MLKKIYHYLIVHLAYWYYGRPARKLIVVGVTGTKGKSTTCRFIASVLESAGNKVGLMSTVEFQVAQKRWLNRRKMTMLGRGEVQKMLRDMVRAGCRYAVIETSSEGILQYRHHCLHYDIAVFTNLGTEHSERHGGFENLRRDKGKLFAALNEKRKIIGGVPVPKVIAVNLDDANAPYFLNFNADKKVGYCLNKPKDSYHLSSIICPNQNQTFSDHSEIYIAGQQYSVNLSGSFNVYNALAAIAVGQTQKISTQTLAKGIAAVTLVPGRMEFIEAGQNFKVIVDYAHEPLSLTALFESLRALVGNNGRVIAVIGSDGGGRDVSKRGKMGEVAGRLADMVVVTDVNCFDEDPRAIAEMLAVGARSAGKRDGQDLYIEIDRRRGFELAFNLARAGDVVVLTAKGTEPCIIVAGGKKIPWDDRAVARELLALPKYGLLTKIA